MATQSDRTAASWACVSINTLKAPLLFTASAAMTTVALHLPTKYHSYLLLPIWLLAAWSLASVGDDRTPACPLSLDSYTAITSFLFMLILPTILAEGQTVGSGPVKEVVGTSIWPNRRSISAACRIWNNPRHLSFCHPSSGSGTWRSRLQFAILRGLKVSVIILVDQWVVQRASKYLAIDGSILDFTPDKHSIVRPLFSQFFNNGTDSYYEPVSGHQLLVRAFLSVSWIWANILILEAYHAALSILFVVVFRLDDPEDWPPLFGSLTEAWTVQRFWGRFWHRIATPTLTTWARLVLPTDPRTGLGKAIVAFGVFFLSGVMHMTAAWRTGEGFAHLDLLFFCANFIAVGAEILVSAVCGLIVRGSKLEGRLGQNFWVRVVRKTAGFLWVFMWFFWAAPRWVYPKTLRWSVKQMLIQSRTSESDLPAAVL